MKNNFKFLIVLALTVAIIISSSIMFFIFSNHESNPVIPFESSITPFNITTTLNWDPYSFSGQSGPLVPNSTVSGTEGLEVHFYATQLPLFQSHDNVSYSINIIHLDGPSNISIKITGSQTEYLSDKRMKSLGENPVQAIINNPVENETYTGILRIQQQTFYHNNTYLFPNTTGAFEYEYNSFYIQPNPINYSIWDHNLTLKISLSGFEDRPLFNYFRKIHGYPVWNDSDFQPLKMEQNGNTFTKRSYEFSPSNNVAGFSTPSWLIYADNKSRILNDNLHLKVTLQTNHPLELTLSFARELLVTYDGYYGYDEIIGNSISHSPIYNNASIDVTLNWNEANFINATILKITKNDTDNYLYVYTTLPGGEYPDGKQMDGVNQTLANYTFNYISVTLKNPSNASQWDAWGKLTTEVSWNPTNTTLAPNTCLMYGNDGNSRISINFNMGSITNLSNQIPFAPDFFLLAIVLQSCKKLRGKRKNSILI